MSILHNASSPAPAGITGHTRLGGLIGCPTAHSISPMMHNDSFRALGLDMVYLCFDVLPEQLGTVIPALRQMKVYGFNVTMPDKEAILPWLDELAPEAELIGAVNTVRECEGKLIGHNTDGTGFMRAAREEGVDIAGKEMILLGAGGAASAIAVQAALDGAKALHLICRRSKSWQHARDLADRISAKTNCKADLTDLADTEEIRRLAKDSRLLVNATPVGMEPDTEKTPIGDASVFHPGLSVADIIYHPRQTLLLKMAAEAGCHTFNGMYMLLWQGAEAFRLWTGREMPAELIRARYFS